MKLFSKRFLAVTSSIALLASAFLFTSCGDDEGEGESDGSKWNRTITVDATDTTKVPSGSYSRYWSQLGSKEKIAGIITTVTIDKSKSTLESSDKRAVVGYMFDYLKSDAEGATDKNRQFCLIGVQPAQNRFYFEHYANVQKGQDSYVTTDSSLGAYTSFVNSSWSTEQVDADWDNLESGVYTDNDTEYSFAIGIFPDFEETEAAAAENAKYKVYIGKDAATLKTFQNSESEDVPEGVQYIGYYKGSNIGSFTVQDSETNQKVTLYSCVGGVCAYANAPSGTKVVATYDTGKTNGEDYVGALFDDVVEE